MIQIPPPGSGVSGAEQNETEELALAENSPPDTAAVDDPADGLPTPGNDSVAKFGALYGYHAEAQRYMAPGNGNDSSADEARQNVAAAVNAPSAAGAGTGQNGIVSNERLRAVGNAKLKTHTETAPADQLRAQQLAALPKAKGFESVQSYVDAIGARDKKAELEEQRKPAAARAIERPPGIRDDVWDASLALVKEGISQEDVLHYLATNTLPDLIDSQGRVVMTGDERMKKLEADARNGSWTAVNTFTFLIGMRRAQLGAEREALTAQREQVAQDPAQLKELDSAIEGSKQLDKELHKSLQTLYRVASYAREAHGQAKIEKASKLAAEAEKARKANDTPKANELETQAAKLRDEGAVIAHHEAKYRASIKAFEPDRAYRLAAQAQINGGAAKVEAMAAGRIALTEAPPSELGTTSEAQNANGVPGAKKLLDEAARFDKTGGKNHAALALENARQGTIARFESEHVKRSSYLDRVDDKGMRPNARSATASAHRASYLDARAEQSRVLMERMRLYSDSGALDDKDAAAAARVAADHANVSQELASVLGTSLSTDESAARQKETATKLDAEATGAEKRAKEAKERADDQANQSERQRKDAGAVFGDTFKWSDDARRDHAAVADANTAERITSDLSGAMADQATAARKEALDANDKLGAVEFQQSRDRADAELARKALAKVETGGNTATVGAAYTTALRSGDDSARIAQRAADQVKKPGADVALARLDIARYWTASSEVDRAAEGDIGKAGAPQRLEQAKIQIDRAYNVQKTLAAGSDDRAEVSSAIVNEKASLAEAIAEFDSREAHHQVSSAETIAFDELRTRPADLARAQQNIGIGAIHAVVRADGHLEEQLKAGTYDANAKDQMYMQAGRLLYADGVTGNPRTDEARQTYQKVKAALDTPPLLLQRAMDQLERGSELAGALTGAMARGQIAAAQGPISRVISGPVYVVTGGDFDMQEEVASPIERGANNQIAGVRAATRDARQGVQDLVDGYSHARQQGQAFRYLDSLRILSTRPSGRDAARLNDFTSARDFVKAQFSEARRNSTEWAAFGAMAWHPDGGAPVAHAIRQPLLDQGDALKLLGDQRLAVVAHVPEAMMINQRNALVEAIDDNSTRTKVKVVAEFVLAVVATRGLGAGAAGARATQAGVAAAETAQAMSALARLARAAAAFRAVHPIIYTAAATTAVGAGMTAVSYGAQRLFGRGSPITQGVDMLMNVVPITAGHSFAGIGNAERRLATIEAQAARLGRLERAVSWSALKAGLGFEQLVAHARFYAPQVALGVLQIEAAQRLLPVTLKAMGLERSELAERALGVIFNTLVSTVTAAAAQPGERAALQALLAERLVQATAHGREGTLTQAESAALQQAVHGELAAFEKSTAKRMPTNEEIAALKASLTDKLRVDGTTDRGKVEAQIIEGAAEALRIERATALGPRLEDGATLTEKDVHRVVEDAADRLLAARGGQGSLAERALAYRDVARFIAESLGARAEKAARQHGATPETDNLLEAQNWAGDRATAVELTAPFADAAPRLVARIEAFYTAELAPARRLLEGRANPDVTAHFAGVEARAAQLGISKQEARAVADQMRLQVFNDGVARALTAAQHNAPNNVSLTNKEVADVASRIATRLGYPKDGADRLTREVLQSRPLLERANALRAGGETSGERAFRELRAVNREVVDHFSNLDAETFVRTFGEKPNLETLGRLAAVKGFSELAASNPARARALLDNPPLLSGKPGNVVDQLLLRSEPFAVGQHPEGHGGARRWGQEGRVIITTNLPPSSLPYPSELRTPRPLDVRQLPTTLVAVPQAQIARETNAVFATTDTEGRGSFGLVRLAELADGRPVAIKKYPGRNTDDRVLVEVRSAIILSELGIGPQFHGIFRDAEGQWNVVMDVVPGDFDGPPVTDQAFRDLDTMFRRLASVNIVHTDDLQAFRTPSGRLVAIDPGRISEAIGQPNSAPPSSRDGFYTIERVGLLQDADAAVGIRYLEHLRATDEPAWRGAMERIQDRQEPELDRRYGQYLQQHGY